MNSKIKTKVLEKNTKTDKQVVSDFERLENELKKIGVEISGKYSLGSPLGDKVVPPKMKTCSHLKKTK